MSTLELSSAADIKTAVLAHLLRRLAESPVEEQPFPHFLVEDIFPTETYQALLESMPPTELMRPMGEKHQNSDGNFNRFEWTLSQSAFDHLPDVHAHLWQGVHGALASPEFKQAVFAKLCNGLSYRFGVPAGEVNQFDAYPRTSLMRETQGYYIAPHPDTRKKIVTMQFALPPNIEQADLGTTFYKRSLVPSDWLRPPRGFRAAKQMPFLPNWCYAFVVLNTLGLKSWHGRELITGASGTRNSLLHIYYTQPAAGEPYEQ